MARNLLPRRLVGRSHIGRGGIRQLAFEVLQRIPPIRDSPSSRLNPTSVVMRNVRPARRTISRLLTAETMVFRR